MEVADPVGSAAVVDAVHGPREANRPVRMLKTELHPQVHLVADRTARDHQPVQKMEINLLHQRKADHPVVADHPASAPLVAEALDLPEGLVDRAA